MIFKVEVSGEVNACYIVQNTQSEQEATKKVMKFLSECCPNVQQLVDELKIRMMVFDLSFDGDVAELYR